MRVYTFTNLGGTRNGAAYHGNSFTLRSMPSRVVPTVHWEADSPRVWRTAMPKHLPDPSRVEPAPVPPILQPEPP